MAMRRDKRRIDSMIARISSESVEEMLARPVLGAQYWRSEHDAPLLLIPPALGRLEAFASRRPHDLMVVGTMLHTWRNRHPSEHRLLEPALLFRGRIAAAFVDTLP
jgi:hypothetical protein